MFSLKRIVPQDAAGDAGAMSERFRVNGETLQSIGQGKPEIGYMLKVGSFHARMFGQDWWRTSPVTEILSEDYNDERIKVTFKTGNSTYEWRQFK